MDQPIQTVQIDAQKPSPSTFPIAKLLVAILSIAVFIFLLVGAYV